MNNKNSLAAASAPGASGVHAATPGAVLGECNVTTACAFPASTHPHPEDEVDCRPQARQVQPLARRHAHPPKQ